MKLPQSTEFDLAILDVNVGGNMIWPVADLIRARNRPIIFATGYGSIPEVFQQYQGCKSLFGSKSWRDDRQNAEQRPARVIGCGKKKGPPAPVSPEPYRRFFLNWVGSP
jgi:hypothetical protein